MNTAQWIKEAEEQARKYSDSLKQNNQYLIDQLVASKNNSLNQLQKQQDNALYNLNTNQSTINKTAEDNAQQAYIKKVLALKSNEQAMNRAGLGTQGIVGSQVNAINSNYGSNLTDVLNEKANALRNLETEKANTNLTYDTNRLNLENEYGTNVANIQKQIEDSALNQYNTVYDKILALKKQEYDAEQERLDREEAKRQYNLNYYTNKKAQEVPVWSQSQQIETNYWSGDINGNTKYGTFGTKDKNGVAYQPNNVGMVNGVVAYLKSSGKKVKDLFGTGNQGQTGANIDNQTVWTVNGRYYIWDGSQNDYIDVTDKLK